VSTANGSTGSEVPTSTQSSPGSSDVLPITLLGNPVLRRRCQEVTAFGLSLADLVLRMFETLAATDNGVGLSANQVGRQERLFVFDFHDGMTGHVVNPVVSAISQELQGGDEACLSIPGLGLPTGRLEHCLVRGVDLHGEPVEFEGEGLSARCFQHEVDHLNGKLYIDLHPIKVRRGIEEEVTQLPWWGHQSIDPRSPLYKGNDEGEL
jgi:peptide deformylase